MQAANILAVVAVIFLAVAGVRIAKEGRVGPQARTWLLVAGIFTLVSAWLWSR